MVAGEIAHKGKIVSLTPEFTTVEIISESACGSCHAAALCGMAELQKKVLELPTRHYSSLREGDEVNLVLRRTMGFKAVWLAYVLPLVVLLAVLLGLTAAGVKELQAGLAAIAAVALYYLVLYLLRDRLRNEYSFYITPITQKQ
ncbi:MAG: SoxR reducing system RseC family protein [Bacteroidales bacterium]|nr:SoxR reducing system RseC family protein [Bacteroidales bacterium]